MSTTVTNDDIEQALLDLVEEGVLVLGVTDDGEACFWKA